MMKKEHFLYILPVLVLCLLYFPVFYSDYAFTDEAYQLWQNKSSVNYTGSFVQGRWLTGVLMDTSFGRISTIAELKLIRIFSFFSWAVFLLLFMKLGTTWQKRIGFDRLLLPLMGVTIACSLSVAVYIGWASCFQVGLAAICSLVSGHLLFTQLMQQQIVVPKCNIRMLFIFITAQGCLFLYQAAFAVFLLPFFFYLVQDKGKEAFRMAGFGAVAYVLINVIYYLLFLYAMKLAHLHASTRAAISMDIVQKLSFFFSIPLSQAFSLNMLYNLHSAVSQAFPILLMLGWLGYFLFTKKYMVNRKIIFLVCLLLMLLLMYAPVMLARENFASYRTMFALNLAVSFLLFDTLLSFCRSAKIKSRVLTALIIAISLIGYWNFNAGFLKPLAAEYAAIKNFIVENDNRRVTTVYFLQPPENLFYSKYGVTTCRDEFGEPSTFKDWTPEPLVKQLMFENTNDRIATEQIIVKQFTEKPVFEKQKNNSNDSTFFIDVQSLFYGIR